MSKTLLLKILLLKPLRKFAEKYHAVLPTLLFIFGILFDILTLERIDHWSNLVQQGAFLIIVGIFLSFESLDLVGQFQCPRIFSYVWKFRELIIHFMLGALLSANTIFYFKSSSLLSSFIFFAVLCIMLVANELPRFQRFGLPVRCTLYSLCLVSYLCFLIPILTSSIGASAFLSSVSVSLFVILLTFRLVSSRTNQSFKLFTRLLIPALSVHILFSFLYFIRAIPPVPISIQYLGIYHHAAKTGERYRLVYTRPKWKFWQHGDQTFYARPKDRPYCFVRIFSPTAFKHQVQVHWLRFDKGRGWQTWDRIPIKIVGGRAEGYRGYTYKENYLPGRWRIQIETSDGREIGRIYFSILPDPSAEERHYKIEFG